MQTLITVVAVGMATPFVPIQTSSEEITTIQWTDLAAEGELFKDPLAKLKPRHLEQLGYILRVKRLIAQEKISAAGRDAKDAAKISKQLEQKGIEVDWLLIQRERISDIRARQLRTFAKKVAERFKQKRVSLTGFVVPIATRERRVTEFFLVPSASACSHGSFPPSTQMIHVIAPEGIAISNPASALRITGILSQKTTRETFNFPGNSITDEAAYAISPTAIKVIPSTSAKHPYKTGE